MEEKFIASLIGVAVGDTLGMPVEGWKKKQIKKYIGRITEPRDSFVVKDSSGNEVTEDEFGKLKYWTKGLKAGQYTDDTILTLAVAESIADKGRIDLHDISKRHLHEFYTRIDAGEVAPFGGTTRKAMENLKNGRSPYLSGVLQGPGNAPPMKMAPVGLYMAATDDYEGGLRHAQEIGYMTHHDPRSVISGMLQAFGVYKLLTRKNGYNRENFLADMFLLADTFEGKIPEGAALSNRGGITERITWIMKHPDAQNEDAHKELGSSSLVFSSYPFTLFMFQKYWNKPLEGLIETVNFGGDCDTTGAMYGALAGALHGAFYPKEWLPVLEGRERLEHAARGIYLLPKYKVDRE